MARRLKAPAIPVPQTRTDFECLAADLAGNMREVDRINSRLADDITALKVAAKRATEEVERTVGAQWVALCAYAEAHRSDLLPTGRKSVTLAAGTLGWRLSNPKVVLTLPEEEVITALEEAGLHEALREVVEIDKTTLLARRDIVDAVPGLAIAQEVRIFFAPLDLSGEKTKASQAVFEEAA